jgi:peptide/nickel transport system permease protein
VKISDRLFEGDEARQPTSAFASTTRGGFLAGISEARRGLIWYLRPLLRSWLRLGGVIILATFVFVALVGPLVAPQDPNVGELGARLSTPYVFGGANSDYLLGTDELGRDILTRIVYGSRVSLLVGLSSVAIAGVIGVVLGLLTGYYGGVLDAVVMRLADVQLAFPFILLAIAILAVLGPGLLNVIVVLGLAGWVGYARIVRGQVLSQKERDYVMAARSLGIPDLTIIFRHLLPNCVTPVIVIATFAVANNIIAEAGLSFLGLGVGVDIPTWGAMLAEGRAYLTTAWWLATLPGAAIFLVVLSINLIGDWIRDLLDPRLRNVLQ